MSGRYDSEVETALSGLSKLAEEPHNVKLREEVNDYLRENIGDDVDRFKQLSTELQNLGILGDIALAEFDRVDDLGRKDGTQNDKIETSEARAASMSSDPLIRLAGNFYSTYREEAMASDNATDIPQWFSGITQHIPWVKDWTKDNLERDELKHYLRQENEKRDGGLLSDSVGFGDPDNSWEDREDTEDDDDDSGDSDDDENSDRDAIVDDDRFEDMKDSRLEKFLSDDDHRPADRLRAAWELATERGIKQLTLKDGDEELVVEISTDSNGYISLWTPGFNAPIMKGVVREGRVEMQDGNSYFGKAWRDKHDESMFD